MSHYSELKALWHLDKIHSLRSRGRCIPAQIQLVISDLCNHDCPWCAYRMEGYSSNQHFGEMVNGVLSNNPKRFIPTDKAKSILTEAHAYGVKAVQFTGGGEPTVHPDHMEIFEHALSLGLQASLVTNGNILREGWQDVLTRFSWIRVSLDAGSPQTYAAMRRVKPTFFHKALDNIRDLSDEISIHGSCVLGTSFIVMKGNWFEATQAASLAKAAGASSIRFAAMFGPEMAKYYEGWYEDAAHAVQVAQVECQTTRFKVIDMVSRRYSDLERGGPDYDFCGYQHFNVYIGGDLNVYRCCNTAYNDLGLIGSLKDTDFASFMESPETNRVYLSFNARSCGHCAFNGQNKAIGYVVSHKPIHVDFV